LTFAARSTISPRNPSTPPTLRQRPRPGGIILNFGGVDYIDSAGIVLIGNLLAKARASKRRLLVYGLSNHYVEIFDITRLSDFVSIFPDEESALSGASAS
jgi:anti-sigma B factor antagonist